MEIVWSVIVLLLGLVSIQAKLHFSQTAGDGEIEEIIRKTYSSQSVGLNQNGDCRCSRQQCGCCVPIDIPKIRLHHIGCLNLTYLPHDIGLALTLSFDNRVIKSWQISIKNPPPLCVDLVDLDGAKMCVELYDLNLLSSTFSGCARLKVSVSIIHKTIELGCWHMPLSGDAALDDAAKQL